jgi:Transglycosylase SLT domain.
MLTIHQDNHNTSLLNNKKHFVAKFALAALLALTLLAGVLSTNAQTTHAATNDSYIVSIIRNTFGAYSDQAIRIATCESSLNPNAVNSIAIGNSHAQGLFQILYPSTWVGTSQAAASPFNPAANARAAHDIFVRDGYSWREWECHL